MRHSTDRRAARPVGPPAAALSKMLSRAWSLPPQRNFVAIERNVQVPMSDGAVLLADGGAILALNAGVRDNRAVEQRPDVLVFSSEPLDEPVEVIGDVTAELHVTRDNPNADLFVRLCDVDAAAKDFVATQYSIGLSAEYPSALVVSQTAGKAAAHA